MEHSPTWKAVRDCRKGIPREAGEETQDVERHIVGVIDEKHGVYWCRTGRPRPALPRKKRPMSTYWREQYKHMFSGWKV